MPPKLIEQPFKHTEVLLRLGVDPSKLAVATFRYSDRYVKAVMQYIGGVDVGEEYLCGPGHIDLWQVVDSHFERYLPHNAESVLWKLGLKTTNQMRVEYANSFPARGVVYLTIEDSLDMFTEVWISFSLHRYFGPLPEPKPEDVIPGATSPL